MASIRFLADEETVQTTNLKKAAKVVVVRITDWSLVQVQAPPPDKIFNTEFTAETTTFEFTSNYRREIVANALSLILSPSIKYVKDRPELGQSPKDGFDCSGFVRYVLMMSGLPIPDYLDAANYRRSIRHANEFWDHYGISVHYELHKPGDLIFFSSQGYRPNHVGIVVTNNHYIHSPGQDGQKVRIDPITFEKQTFAQNPGGPRIVFSSSVIGYKSPTIPSGSEDYRKTQEII